MKTSRHRSFGWFAAIASYCLPACALASGAGKFAAPEASTTNAAAGVASISSIVFGLAVVLALIFGFAWITRRVQGMQSSGASIDVVAQISVGQKERIVLINVAGTSLLVGVASGAVTTLHRFAADDAALHALISPSTEGTGAPVTTRFRDILQRSLGGK